MSYELKNFDGVVTVKDGISMPDGRAYYGFAGKVSILQDSEVGIAVNASDSNWIARIESPNGKRSVNLPGCKVQAILQGDFEGQPRGGEVSQYTYIV